MLLVSVSNAQWLGYKVILRSYEIHPVAAWLHGPFSILRYFVEEKQRHAVVRVHCRSLVSLKHASISASKLVPGHVWAFLLDNFVTTLL